MSAATLVAHGADRVPPIVIDARTPEEFAAGHLPGAINVPHATVETAVGSLMSYRTREVVVYCHSGRRARIVIDALAAKGFTHLSHLTGDFPVWQGEGRPVSR
jgi:rhodanese-related sulfurtransferase